MQLQIIPMMILKTCDIVQPICCQCILSLSPAKIRKLEGFLMFSGGTERVHW